MKNFNVGEVMRAGKGVVDGGKSSLSPFSVIRGFEATIIDLTPRLRGGGTL